MDVKKDGANPILTGSTPQSQEVSRTSTDPKHPVIDSFRDKVEHLNISK